MPVRSLTTVRLAAAGLALLSLPALAQTDPRVGLHAGWWDAGQAARGMELIGSGKKAEGFYNPANPGDFGFLNGDLAFKGNIIVQGGFHGFQVWDVADPHNPKLRSTFVCPGGQGDPTLYGNLLFFSVEETRGRLDCGGQGVQDTVSKERFRGVRIFDVTDIDHPKQVAAVQTCRGSHTHTLVVDPKDSKNVYIYVSGTAGVRSPNELTGCSGRPPEQDKNTSLFRIDVIQVPLDHPQDAKVVSNPRIFADAAGNVEGLWKGGSHGEGTQATNVTDQCHDITVVLGDRHGGGRVLGQRPAPRHSRPGASEASRRGVRSELRVLALGDVQQRRHEGVVQRRVGRRHGSRSAARPTIRSGAPTRSSRSITAR